MRKKSISLTLIAIVVMAVAAPAAFAYEEAWNGWMSSGTFYYNSNPYTYSGSGGTFFDSTSTYDEDRDTFYLNIVGTLTIPFVYSATNDTMYLTVAKAMDSTTGGKETGQITDDEAGGIWYCYGYLVNARQNFTIWGTWDGTFTYGGGTPTYSASGSRTNSTPITVTGGFSSSGSRTYYNP